MRECLCMCVFAYVCACMRACVRARCVCVCERERERVFNVFTDSLFFFFSRTLQGERNSVHKNLVACLFIAELLFLTGIDQTQNRVGHF